MPGRRTLLRVAAALLATPRILPAQQPAVRLVWFSPARVDEGAQFLDALRDGLREVGYIEGRNLALEARWAGNLPGRADSIATELAAGNADLIIAQGPTVFALRQAGVRAPVVFAFSGDPVEAGLVKSLAHPEGKLTGLSFLALELAGKRLELLKATLPGLRRVAVVASAQHPGDQAERRASAQAAARLGLELEYFEALGPNQLELALNGIARARCEAALFFPIQTIIANSARIATWANRQRIPTISGWGPFADQGNLLSYGANLHAAFRRLADFADRILRGTAPGSLPVELPRQLEFVVNLRAARGLGLSVPQPVVLRADRLLE